MGASNREIAEALKLSEGTVRNYLSTILNKLDLRDRTPAGHLGGPDQREKAAGHIRFDRTSVRGSGEVKMLAEGRMRLG